MFVKSLSRIIINYNGYKQLSIIYTQILCHKTFIIITILFIIVVVVSVLCGYFYGCNIPNNNALLLLTLNSLKFTSK